MLSYTSSSASMLEPSLFALGDDLHMVSFKAMKIIPAHFIIHKAIARGELQPGGTVVETSSGNFALGMAMVCNQLRVPFVAIGDPAIEPSYQRQLEMLGGRVEIITDKKGSQGYQKARLERLHEILDGDRRSFWCRQYDNEDNGAAYAEVGQQLAAALGSKLTLVAPVGSGGSSSGIASALRAAGVDCTLVGVDTFNSILFGQTDGPRKLRGLGNTVMPKNLKHTLFDHVHWVGAELADHFTRKLYRQSGHFRGPTTGAAWVVARHLAARQSGAPVVFLSPDDGSRYLDSTYAADQTSAADTAFDTATPTPIVRPTAFTPGADWACMAWNRASIHQFR